MLYSGDSQSVQNTFSTWSHHKARAAFCALTSGIKHPNMFASYLSLLFLCCGVLISSSAATPVLVAVQAVNGTSHGMCPPESQLAEARQQLKAEISSVLSRFTDAVSSCNDLPPSSASGYYWISPSGSAPPVQMFCDFTITNPLTSCQDLPPDSPAGYYWTLPSTGPPAELRYCNSAARLGVCGQNSSWTRVGYLNMSNPDHACPSGWSLSASPRRTCGSGHFATRGDCSSMEIATPLEYTEVCGRVVAYHRGVSDGFDFSKSIQYPYLDGLSLTHGSPNSRQHVWSFITAIGEDSSFHGSNICGCSNGNAWPSAYSQYLETTSIGNNYFCDTGNHEPSYSASLLNYDDPLWDGEGCGVNSTCCQLNNPPWFHATLPQPTNDSLELRNCQAKWGDYDSLVELIEIYVK